MKQSERPQICYIKKTGRVLVFDGCGRHIEELEGPWTEKEEEIRRAAPEIIIIDWRLPNETISDKP